jgi:signal peptidase I
MQEDLKFTGDEVEVFRQQGGEQVGLLEIASGIFLRGEPDGKRIRQVEYCPFVAGLPGDNLKFINFSPESTFLIFIVDAEDHPLWRGGIIAPGNRDIFIVGLQQSLNPAHEATPSLFD